MAATPGNRLHSPHPKRLVPGDTILVRRSGTRTPRAAVVLDIRSSECLSTGQIVIVRWLDDQTVTAVIPGTEVEVVATT